MTDKERLAEIERCVWELRAEIVAARFDGLTVEVRLGGAFTGGPTLFNDLFDTVDVLGTRTAAGHVSPSEFNRMVEAA